MLHRIVLASLALLSVSIFAKPVHADSIRVAAAASLKEVVTELSAAFEAKSGVKVEPSFNASGQIAAQIRAGAPVDVFVSAGVKEVDDLAKEKLLDVPSRTVVAGNAVVLIVPLDATNAPTTFAELVNVKRLAIGQPKVVPAGLYATQVLDALQLSDGLKDKLVYGQNVRQVLDYVVRGEVDAGIVYRTDAATEAARVRVVATAEASTHKPVQYIAVVVAGTKNPSDAGKFVAFLTSRESQAVFEKFGFTIPVPTTAP